MVMCGRFVRKSPPKVFGRLFDAKGNVDAVPGYNVSPSQDVLVARTAADGERELVLLRWGLIPSWAKDPKIGYRTINARAETVAAKPAFRAAFKRRRCLVACDGFYEWSVVNGKQPYFIHMADDAPFGFAGLYEHWEGAGQAIESCTIIVGEPNAMIARIHDRMPAILDPKDYDIWLDPDVTDAEHLLPLLRPYAADKMAAYPVSRQVNSPRNQGPSLTEPLAAETGR
jgi:putative SOS response-associated peptidase YedK